MVARDDRTSIFLNAQHICAFTFLLLCLLLLAGCETIVRQTEPVDFMARAEKQTEGSVQVTSAVLSPEETLASFAFPLDDKNIQPVWVEIENRGNDELYLMLLSIDPEYFSPSEVAWSFRNFEDQKDTQLGTYAQKADYFLERQVPVRIPPRSTVAGFIYTNLDPGRKAFTVELLGKNKVYSFDYFQPVPGFRPDFSGVDMQSLNESAEQRDLSLDELRTYLEELPCCAAGGDRKTPGDPLNLVFVGSGETVLAAMARQGWDLTEMTRASTVGRMVASSVFKSMYRTSPVSPLYLFDRRQDAALQEVRANVDERNHMRLWRAPVNMNGIPVWVGQVSRDIGIRLSAVTGVTHKIDPLVDEARLFVTLETIAAQSLEAVGYVSGVGAAGRNSGRTNYTRDPYYTDGNRVVIFLADHRVPPEDITYLDWEEPLSSKIGGPLSIER